MITLRHHLLTIVAVFLALAVGIVLGGGPLSDLGERARPTSAAPSTDAGEDTQASYSEDFAAAVAPQLVAGKLTDRQVAIVTMPGADEQVTAALAEEVDAADGSVAARYALAESMVDPAQKSLVDTLGSQLMTQRAGRAVEAEASTYDRMGQLLGLAFATSKPEGEDVNDKSRAITEAVTGASLMEAVGGVERRAPLVLVVLGTDSDDEGSDAILAGLASGLGKQSVGVVVAGTTADGTEGQLTRFRTDPAATQVASVDGIDTSAGRATTALTLARSLSTQGGFFGAAGSDGPVPLG